MEFPEPFKDYAKDPNDEGRFFIPWYKKVPFLKNNINWCMWLGMGISNVKLNGLWIDYFTIALL